MSLIFIKPPKGRQGFLKPINVHYWEWFEEKNEQLIGAKEKLVIIQLIKRFAEAIINVKKIHRELIFLFNRNNKYFVANPLLVWTRFSYRSLGVDFNALSSTAS